MIKMADLNSNIIQRDLESNELEPYSNGTNQNNSHSQRDQRPDEFDSFLKSDDNPADVTYPMVELVVLCLSFLYMLHYFSTILYFFIPLADVVTDFVTADHYRARSKLIQEENCLLYKDANGTIRAVSPEDLLTLPRPVILVNTRFPRPSSRLDDESEEPLLNFSIFYALTLLFIFLPWVATVLFTSCKGLLWFYVLHNFDLSVDLHKPLPSEWLEEVLKSYSLTHFLVAVILKLLLLIFMPLLIFDSYLRELSIRRQLYKIEKEDRDKEKEEIGLMNENRVKGEEQVASQNSQVADGERELTDIQIARKEETQRLRRELLSLSKNRFFEAYLRSAPQFVLQMSWRILDGVSIGKLFLGTIITSLLTLFLVAWHFNIDAMRNNPNRRHPTWGAMWIMILIITPTIISNLLVYSVLFGSTTWIWKVFGAAIFAFYFGVGVIIDVCHISRQPHCNGEDMNVNKVSKNCKLFFNLVFRGYISSITLLFFRIKQFDEKNKIWKDESDTEEFFFEPKKRFCHQLVYFLSRLVLHVLVVCFLLIWNDPNNLPCLLNSNFSSWYIPICTVIVAGPVISIIFLIIDWTAKSRPALFTLDGSAIMGLYESFCENLKREVEQEMIETVKELQDKERRKLAAFRGSGNKSLFDHLNNSPADDSKRILFAAEFVDKGLPLQAFLEMFVDLAIKTAKDKWVVEETSEVVEALAERRCRGEGGDETFIYRCYTEANSHNFSAAGFLWQRFRNKLSSSEEYQV